VGLKLNNINKSYASNAVLKDINLEVADKEFIVLVGPSGSGKSTLMRVIAGLDQEFSGELYKNNQLISTFSPKERNVSMVFQNYALYPHKSVYDNIAFPLMISGLSKQEIKKKVNQAAAKLGLSEYLNRKPKALSGGQRQRVALARALVKTPDLFLLDEPLSNLDAKLRASTRLEIKNLQQELDSIFIYVTHDQIEAMSLGDRIVVLDQGEIQQVAAPETLYNDPANAFVANFIGTPPCNLIQGEDFTVGIRPEYLKIAQQAPNGSIDLNTILSKNIDELKELFMQKSKNIDSSASIKSLESTAPVSVKLNSPMSLSKKIIHSVVEEKTLHLAVEFIEQEYFGAESYIYTKLNEQIIVVKQNSELSNIKIKDQLKTKQKVFLSVGLSNLYFFDKASGTRIRI
jgi:multiple sugar transport system ATP-binding protein